MRRKYHTSSSPLLQPQPPPSLTRSPSRTSVYNPQSNLTPVYAKLCVRPCTHYRGSPQVYMRKSLGVFLHKDINSGSSNIDITVCRSFAYTCVSVYLIELLTTRFRLTAPTILQILESKIKVEVIST